MAAIPCITFRLGQGRFALRVEHVREVVELEHLDPLPCAPSCLLGVINIRGQAVPVVDLRTKFGIKAKPPAQGARVLVLNFEQDGRRHTVGGVADAVEEVVDFDSETTAPPPSLGGGWSSDVLEGVTLHRGSFTQLLKVAGLFTGEDLAALVPAAACNEACAEGDKGP